MDLVNGMQYLLSFSTLDAVELTSPFSLKPWKGNRQSSCYVTCFLLETKNVLLVFSETVFQGTVCRLWVLSGDCVREGPESMSSVYPQLV